MKLEQLKMLATIARSGSLRAAAEQLHKTQPALTHAIKNLEEELDINLFDREHYRIKLTPSGQAFLNRAQQLLDNANQLQQYAKILAAGVEPTLRIMINPLCLSTKILTCIKNCTVKYPSMEVILSTGTLNQPLIALENDLVDLIIAPLLINQPTIKTKKIGKIKLLNVMQTKTFNKMQLKKSISTPHLSKLTQIVVSTQPEATNRPGDSYGLSKDSPKWYVSDHYTKKNIIMAGLGWGRLPEQMIARELKNKRLTKITVPGVVSPEYLPVIAAHSKAKLAGPGLQNLWKTLNSAVTGF